MAPIFPDIEKDYSKEASKTIWEKLIQLEGRVAKLEEHFPSNKPINPTFSPTGELIECTKCGGNHFTSECPEM